MARPSLLSVACPVPIRCVLLSSRFVNSYLQSEKKREAPNEDLTNSLSLKPPDPDFSSGRPKETKGSLFSVGTPRQSFR